MAGLTDLGKNLMLNGFADDASHVSLHTADPGLTGDDEVGGGTYARVEVDWAAAASGSVVSASPIVFNVPGSTTINHLGYWDSDSGGTFYGSRALDTPQTFATAGTYTIAAGNLTETIT